jgi:putative transposase
LLVLRQEVGAAAAEPKPKLDRADRAVIAALARLFPGPLRIPPATQRSQPTWRQFLRTLAANMLACDFFHVDCAAASRFLLIEVGTRYVRVLSSA